MINKFIGIGNLGADPETRHTQDGTTVCSFTIACSEKYKDGSGNMQESTEWVPVVAWRRLAEICSQYLVKGSRVYIEGKLQTRKYTANDGTEKFKTEIVAREMKNLSPRECQGERNNTNKYDDDTIPF